MSVLVSFASMAGSAVGARPTILGVFSPKKARVLSLKFSAMHFIKMSLL
jgi:hypothetical protein